MKMYQGMLFIVLLLMSGMAFADSIQNPSALLSVKPKRCVALHQGLKCYQKLSFKFQTPSTNQFCLYRESIIEPLICWQGSELTKYMYKFEATHSDVFFISDRVSNEILAREEVRVAWVYKNKGKVPSGWRLF